LNSGFQSIHPQLALSVTVTVASRGKLHQVVKVSGSTLLLLQNNFSGLHLFQWGRMASIQPDCPSKPIFNATNVSNLSKRL
jgi:hypothetical protein